MLTNNIIKCPCCGSSAQVRISIKSSPYNAEIKNAYNCGCGCEFIVPFKAKDYKIINTPIKER